MVSDEDLATRLIQVLITADLTTTTTGAIRRQLEQDLGVDLSDKKAFIREQVDLYLQSPQLHGSEAQAQDLGHLGQPGAADDEDGVEEDGDSGDSAGRGNDREPDSRRLKAKINRAIKNSLPKEEKKKAVGGGLNKLCGLSPQLQLILGESELPRTQVVKQLWVYIRNNNLQDPQNKRRIICNSDLRAVFGTESTDMFKMNKLLSKHIWPLDNAEDEGESKARKQKTEKSFALLDEGEPKPKKQKAEKKEGGRGKNSAFLAPIPLSEALVNFLGTGESELPRTEVVKRMWDYIKDNQLQDPADKRRIICDGKLQMLFGCETFVGFGMMKLLAPHFVKG